MTESEFTLSVVSDRMFDVLKSRVQTILHKFYQNIRVARVSHIECCISGHSGHGLSNTFDLLDCHTISYNSCHKFSDIDFRLLCPCVGLSKMAHNFSVQILAFSLYKRSTLMIALSSAKLNIDSATAS